MSEERLTYREWQARAAADELLAECRQDLHAPEAVGTLAGLPQPSTCRCGRYTWTPTRNGEQL